MLDSEIVRRYVAWFHLATTAIRSSDPTAKVVLISQADRLLRYNPLLQSILSTITSKGLFDVVDVHHWRSAAQYKMPMVREICQHLDSIGLRTVTIWSCENGMWAYQPMNHPFQTQEKQARSLIRRYVFNIDLGLDKLFWNNLMEWIDFGRDPGNIFNSMRLIGDGMRNGETPQNINQPRVSYHAYKLLVQVIDVDKARYDGKMSIRNRTSMPIVTFCFQVTATLVISCGDTVGVRV